MSKNEYLEELKKKWSDCQNCGLCETRRNVVFGYGNPDARIMVIAEAPGEMEDGRGVPMIGPSGNLLDQYLAAVSTRPELVDLLEKDSTSGTRSKTRELLLDEFYFTNIVACRPPENRDPTAREIGECWDRLKKIIYTVDPDLIIAMGGIAISSLLKKSIKITKSRGEIFDLTLKGRLIDIQYPVLAILHTSYLLRLNDFSQEGGLSDRTYADVLKAHSILDELGWLHSGEAPPRNRPRG